LACLKLARLLKSNRKDWFVLDFIFINNFYGFTTR